MMAEDNDSLDDTVEDSRDGTRFTVGETIAGTFGSASVLVRGISERGLQIEHAAPLNVGLRARASIRTTGETVIVAARVAWSRLSTKTGPDGKLLYSSGLRLEDEEPGLRALIDTLIVTKHIEPDRESLERKRRKLAARAAQKAGQSRVKMLISQELVPDDLLLLIHQARERLRANPDESLKWYNRGKYAMAEHNARLEEMNLPHREEVFAVWEYLERTIDLVTVARAFDQRK